MSTATKTAKPSKTIPMVKPKSVVVAPRMKIQRLSILSMRVNHKYQRSLKPGKIADMLSKWDYNLCDPIVVSIDENGVYWVWEGQHRREVLLKLGVVEFDCRIVDAPTEVEQAAGFSEINKGRTSLAPLDAFRADRLAQDPQATDIGDVADSLGLSIKQGGDVVAIAALNDIYRRGGKSLVRDVLTIARDAWADTGYVKMFDKSILKGLATFRRLYPQADLTLLTLALGNKRPMGIIDEIKLGSPKGVMGPGANGVCASVMMKAYNVEAKKLGFKRLRAHAVKP